MKRILAVAALVATVALNGCGLVDSDEDRVDFEGLKVDGTVYVGGGTRGIEGRLDGTNEIERFWFEVYDSSDEDVSNSFDFVFDELNDRRIRFPRDTEATIRATDSDLPSGEYRLVVVARISGRNFRGEAYFNVINDNEDQNGDVEPDPTPVNDVTVTLGGHGNNDIGSSVNLDNGQVMMATAAKESGSGVDIVYTYSGVLNSPVLMTPVYTKEDSNIGIFADWNDPHDTRFHKVAMTSAEFNNVESVEEVEELFDPSETFEGRVPCAQGDVFVVETTEGAYVLIRIDTVSSDATGTATIKVLN
ncbi:hypothetical protein QA601_16525 [Chitinispirillales bacterium ANBcel5]|uniref:hypothetical protein n=1 Tax=Cellulosispirillum alkaliphilum TaxID=3039283 RepID=UPI002A52F524|nr:hypothetical protein [Chitinispirillales bacterium ANBcel5]